MTRILAFSPYASWHFHTKFEATITQACQVRGAEVKHILCDGILSECDVYKAAESKTGRPFDLCQKCQADARAALAGTGLDCDWLSRSLSPEDRAAAFAWAQRLVPEEFAGAQYNGYPVGRWVTSSVVTYFRTYPIRLDDWHTVNVFRGFLHGAALTCIALDRILDRWPPDALVLFNGRMSVTQVAFHLARRRGIRVLIHERPLRPGTLFVSENEICISPVPFKRLWRQWADVPLTSGQLEEVARWIRDRRFGTNQKGIHQFASTPEGAESLKRGLGLAPGRPLLALFTSSTDEFAGTPLADGPFASQEEWIERIVAWAARRPDCDLVIRCHPCLAGRAGTGTANAEIAWFRSLDERLPANVRIVFPDDPLSSYDLVDCADVGITYGSTIGLEMFATGKPVVTTLPLPTYAEVPGVLLVSEADALDCLLDRALTLRPSRAYRRYGFRCIYRYFFHMSVPFPLVSVVRLYESRYEYETTDALTPGRDPSLDRLCGFLLEGTPIFPGPDAPERARTTTDEDAFFERLEADGHWLEAGWKGAGQAQWQTLRARLRRKRGPASGA